MSEKKLRAVIYVRLSSYRGADDPTTSPARQREACEQYAAAQGWTVVEVVEDLDVSGSTRGERLDRPGLKRIRAMWGSVDVVVFLKLDRLARSVVDFHTFAEEAAAHGAALVSVRDGLDLTTPNGRFVASLLAAFAELEAETISDRTREGRRKAAALGRWTGGPSPMGFEPAPNPDGPGKVLAVCEPEAAALREAADRLAAGDNVVAVTRWMNEESGIRPRRAAAWSVNSLRSALMNEAASSRILSALQRRTVAEALRPAETRTYAGRKPARLLSRLLLCGSCGRRMKVAARSSGEVVYRCLARSHGQPCTSPMAISAPNIEEAVTEAWLGGFGGAPETRSVRLGDEVSEQLARLDEEIDTARLVLGRAPRDERAAALEALEALETARDDAESEPASAFTVMLRATGRTLGDAWETGSVDTRRELLATTIGSLTILPGRRGGRQAPSLDRVADAWRFDPDFV